MSKTINFGKVLTILRSRCNLTIKEHPENNNVFVWEMITHRLGTELYGVVSDQVFDDEIEALINFIGVAVLGGVKKLTIENYNMVLSEAKKTNTINDLVCYVSLNGIDIYD